MRHEKTITSQHHKDADGNPGGGHASTRGLSINWQNGPLKTPDGEPRARNGAFVEDAIDAAADRLQAFQDSKFACAENEEALAHLRLAREALDRRTQDRETRGVESSHQV